MATFQVLLAVSLGCLLFGTDAAGDDPKRPAPIWTPPSKAAPTMRHGGNSSQPKGRLAGPQPAMTRHGQPSGALNGSKPGQPMTTLKDGSAIHRDPSGKVIEVHAANGAVISMPGPPPRFSIPFPTFGNGRRVPGMSIILPISSPIQAMPARPSG
jgi:hypothetical protein